MPTTLTFSSLLADLRVYAERAFTFASDPLVFNQLPRLVNLAERRCATELKVQGFIKNVTDSFQTGLDVYPKPDRWREWVSVNMGTATSWATASRSAAAGTRTLVLHRPHPFVAGDVVVITGVGGTGYDGTFTLTLTTQLSVLYNSGIATEALTLDNGGLLSDAMERREPLFPRSYEYVRNYGPDPRITGVPRFYADYDYYHFMVVPTPARPYPYELNYYELPPMLDDTHQTNWLTDISPNLLLYAALLEMSPFLKNQEMRAIWQESYDRAGQAITGQDMAKIEDRTSERNRP